MDIAAQIYSLFNLLMTLSNNNYHLLDDAQMERMFKTFLHLIDPEKITVYISDWQKAKQEADAAELKKFGAT